MQFLLILLIFSLQCRCSFTFAFGTECLERIRSRVLSCRGSPGDDIFDSIKLKEKVAKNFLPLVGYYALMLAPIYGVGIGPFGSMTDFSILRNRGSPTTIANEYIVAPADFTPARTNQKSKVYPVSMETLERIVDEVVTKEPRVVRIAEDSESKRREYVQRSLIFRFPDVVTFQYIPIDNARSTLAVHSYSVYGESDFGVNGNRVRSWLDKIDAKMPN